MKQKSFLRSLAIVVACGIISYYICGCTTSQQRVAYNTIYSVQQAADAAYDGYCTAVIKGIARTNEVPQVSIKYNQLHSALLLAAVTSQNGTNALAPEALTSELVDLTSLITSLTTK